MAQDIDTSDMRLTTVLKEWLTKEEWADEIEINDDRDFATVITNFEITGQNYWLFLCAAEQSKVFFLSLHSPFNVLPERMDDMCRIFNRINLRLLVGGLCCDGDEDSNPVQYRVGIDVEGVQFVSDQIDSMLSTGEYVFEYYGQLLATVVLTDTSADAAWSKFLEEEERKEDETAAGVEPSGPNVVPFKRD